MQVNLIVKEALKFLRSSLPSSIQIRSNLASDGKVLADPTQIYQVLMNLSSNAMHAMRHNGGVLEVCLEAFRIDIKFATRHPEAVADAYMKLTVADNGEGIPAETIKNIFDPFSPPRPKRRARAWGLR